MGEFYKLPRFFSCAAQVVGHPSRAVIPSGNTFVPQETWAVSGDIVGCHSWGWWCYWYLSIEGKYAAKHLPRDGTIPKTELFDSKRQ